MNGGNLGKRIPLVGRGLDILPLRASVKLEWQYC